jgi:hypothetical protein
MAKYTTLGVKGYPRPRAAMGKEKRDERLRDPPQSKVRYIYFILSRLDQKFQPKIEQNVTKQHPATMQNTKPKAGADASVAPAPKSTRERITTFRLKHDPS